MKTPTYILISAVAGLVVLEIAARVLIPGPVLPSFYEIGWDGTRSAYLHSPTADPDFVKNPHRETNQLLLRGRPFANEAHDKTRILLVGDSQVEAAALPFHDIPESLLEKTLEREFATGDFMVRSIATSAWGQDQQLLALRRYFEEFKADYIFLWFTHRNDFWENGFPDRSTNTCLGLVKPTFVRTPKGLMSFDFDPYKSILGLFLSNSRFYRRAAVIGRRWKICQEPQLHRDWDNLVPIGRRHREVPRAACPPTLLNQWLYSRDRVKYPNLPISLLSEELFLESRSHFSPFLQDTSDRDEYLISVTRALIEEIALVSRAHGAKLIIFFVNQSFKEGPLDFAAPGTCVTQSGRWFKVADIRDRLKNVFAGANLIELKAAHPAVSLDDVSVARTDRHLNKLGNQLVFDELVAALKRRGLVAPKGH